MQGFIQRLRILKQCTSTISGHQSAAKLVAIDGTRGFNNHFNAKHLAGLTAALTGAAALLYSDTECRDSFSHEKVAHCDVSSGLPTPTANPKDGHFLQNFHKWLHSRGCETRALDIRPSVENPAAGVSLFLSEEASKTVLQRSWWEWCKSWIRTSPDLVLGRVPLDTIVFPKTIIADPKLGSLYRTLLENGVVTDRQLILLFLIVERIRGSDSEWGPWINVLPQAFNTPLHYGISELEELHGTTLYTATKVLDRSLRAQWSVLSPYVEQILRETGVEAQGMSATFQDFMWAHSIFWSRSITFPAPTKTQSTDESENESSLNSTPSEAIVPGIDLCNHSTTANSRWSVWNPALLKDGQPVAVGLVSSRKAGLKSGDELHISYGDKSNEELLMQYGFTIDNNPNDSLMIVLDLGPRSEWDTATEAKMRILLAKGLSPQLFLTQEELRSDASSDCTLEQVGLDPVSWEVIETLLMEDDSAIAAAELVERSTGLLSTADCPSVSPVSSNNANSEQAEGRRLSLLSTLTQILEHKCQELEDGTGSLQDDIKILEGVNPTTLPQVYSSVVYRAAQKRLAQGFRTKAKKALAKQMVRMQAQQSKIAK